MRIRSFLTALASSGALLSGQAAQAQVPCTSEEEMSALAVYAVPPLIGAVQIKCAAELSPSGYFATSAAEFSGRYEAHRATVWPMARDVIFRLAASTDNANGEFVKAMQDMPAEAVQPMLDAVLIQKVASEIKPSSCAKIEHGMEVLAPIEPQEAGAIIAFVLGVTAPKDIVMCPMEDQ